MRPLAPGVDLSLAGPAASMLGNLLFLRRRALRWTPATVASWKGPNCGSTADSPRATIVNDLGVAAGWLAAGPFDRFLGGRPVDVPALEAFEDPQIRDHRNRVRCRSASCDPGTSGTVAAASKSALVRDAHTLRTCRSPCLFGGRCCAPGIATGTAAAMEAEQDALHAGPPFNIAHIRRKLPAKPRSWTEQYCSAERRDMDQYAGSQGR